MDYRTLDIAVQHAKDLKYVNLISDMDVYVVVSIIGGDHSLKQKTRTPVDHGGNTDPMWNFPMRFTINEAYLRSNSLTIKFKVVCEGALWDTAIGVVQVPMKDLTQSDANQLATYPVMRPSGNFKGHLNISYLFPHKIPAPAAPPPYRSPAPAYTPPPPAAYTPPPPAAYTPPPQSEFVYVSPPPSGYRYQQAGGYGNPLPPPPAAAAAAMQQQKQGKEKEKEKEKKKKNKSGMGMGVGIGLGAGLVGGMLIGEMISDAGHRGRDDYGDYSGDFADDSGADFGDDNGGDFNDESGDDFDD